MENVSTFTIAPFLPQKFYMSTGSGQSHFNHQGGSFHNALIDMQAGNVFNVDFFIMPANIEHVEKPIEMDVAQCSPAVICCCNGIQGENISSCIAVGWMYGEDDLCRFGIVAKVAVKEEKEQALKYCLEQLDSINKQYYAAYTMKDVITIAESIYVSQKYGTVLSAIVFNEMILPFKGF